MPLNVETACGWALTILGYAGISLVAGAAVIFWGFV